MSVYHKRFLGLIMLVMVFDGACRKWGDVDWTDLQDRVDAVREMTEAAVRGMVASGLGAAVLRIDQAQAAVEAGELRIWPHWQDETWLCWLQQEGPEDHALAVLRELVQEVWED